MTKVYVEFNLGIDPDGSSDWGTAEYILSGTTNTFTITTRALSGGFEILVQLTSTPTAGNVFGSVINLGWREDGDMGDVLGE